MAALDQEEFGQVHDVPRHCQGHGFGLEAGRSPWSPKHSGWLLGQIVEATENEVRAYSHLRNKWGELVPRLVLRGPDFKFALGHGDDL